MHERGFTLLEIAVASVFMAMIFGTAAVGIATDTRVERVLTASLGPEMAARHALERLRSEISMAGIWGEDSNHNGALDPGEDLNGDGRLDADWDLSDGTADQTSLSFNQRRDVLDPETDKTTLGVYTGAVRFQLDGEQLVRWENGRRKILAHKIRNLRFKRDGAVITIELDVVVPERDYAKGIRVLSTRVWLRN